MSKTRRHLSHTFINTSILLVLQVLNILISTQWLGSEGRGEISLYLLHIAIGAQVASMVGGEALVFFMPRYNLKSIFKNAMLWNVAVTVGSLAIFLLLFDKPFIAIMIGLSIGLQSTMQTLVQMNNGRQQIKTSNHIFLIAQGLFSLILVLLVALDALSVNRFIIAFAIGLAAAIVFAFSKWRPLQNTAHLPSIGFKECFTSGSIIQLGNLAQVLNTRLSYFLLSAFFTQGKAMVGVLSTALLVGEKSLVVPKSLGRVQYAELANRSKNRAFQSMRYLKLYLLLSIPILVLICLLPNPFYTFIFGNGFAEVGQLIRILTPGMLFLMMSNAMSNHFAGEGQYKINAQCTFLALAISSTLAFIYIPKHGMIAAAVCTDIAFVCLALSQIWIFIKQNKKDLPKRWLLPNKQDIDLIRGLLNKIK